MTVMKYTIALLLAHVVFAQSPAATLGVTGDLPMPLKLTLADLAAMPRQTAKVPSANGPDTVYEGVTLFEILKRAGAPNGGSLRGNALASYVLAKASDGYQVVFTLGEIDPSFGNQTILVADHRDGAPLSGNQGSIRLVVPNDHEGARSVRMLETLEFVRLKK
jgi:Oxidoreductase molybdopterin binding domain